MTFGKWLSGGGGQFEEKHQEQGASKVLLGGGETR